MWVRERVSTNDFFLFLRRLLTGMKIKTEEDALQVSSLRISHCAISNLVYDNKKYKA